MKEEISPFPLDGGRAGDGGEGLGVVGEITPNPDPSPHKGEGRRASISTARRLRREATVAERDLWKELRARRLNIRRQAPIGPYIADFACHSAKLIVEIDGYYHDNPDAQSRDARRTHWLEQQGYRVIRFSEKAAREDTFSVADQIACHIAKSPPTPAHPSVSGTGENAHA